MTRLPSTAGVRRKLTNQVLREIFEHWNTIEPGCKETRGRLTLTHLYRAEPATYAKLIAALLPKDVVIESAVGELDDEQLDALIDDIRLRLEEKRAIAAKLIEDKNGDHGRQVAGSPRPANGRADQAIAGEN